MAKIKNNPAKRYGARYGSRIREMVRAIEVKPEQKCPYCSALKVKRLAAGIWTCGRCKAKFTGRAYQVK